MRETSSRPAGAAEGMNAAPAGASCGGVPSHRRNEAALPGVGRGLRTRQGGARAAHTCGGDGARRKRGSCPLPRKATHGYNMRAAKGEQPPAWRQPRNAMQKGEAKEARSFGDSVVTEANSQKLRRANLAAGASLNIPRQVNAGIAHPGERAS